MNGNEALTKLMDGNRGYVEKGAWKGDVSKEIRLKTAALGQKPYAIINRKGEAPDTRRHKNHSARCFGKEVKNG